MPLHRTCAEPTPLIPQRKKTYPRPLIRPHTSRILARSGGADRWRPVAERGAVPATRPIWGTTRRGTTSPAHEDDGPRRPGRPSSSSPSGTTTGCQELALRAVRAGPEPPPLQGEGWGGVTPSPLGKGPEKGDRRSVTMARASTRKPEARRIARSARTEALRHRGGRSVERPIHPEQSGTAGVHRAPATPSLCEGRNEEGRVNNPERTPLAGAAEACLHGRNGMAYPQPVIPAKAGTQ